MIAECEKAGGNASGLDGGGKGYGCTAKGDVQCSEAGKCKGSCEKCGTREASGDIIGILQPAGGGKAESKSTPATDPKGKVGVGKGDVKQPSREQR